MISFMRTNAKLAIGAAVLLLCFLQSMSVAALRTDAEVVKDLGVNSQAVFLQDIDHGKTILSHQAHKKLPIASLTKIMTALVVLEHRNLDEAVVITNEMVGNLGDYVAIGLRAGQRVTIEDLLYATMLPSAGDAAQALAISTSGSIANFANAMNQKAKELGLKNTHFSNPVGMNEDNYSTAHDMAIILQAALKNKTFAKIFQTYKYQLKSVNLTAEKTFTKRPDIIGGKTGYTQLAGRCLASNSKLNGVNYILVTLGANPNSTEHLKDASRIYTYVKETYIEREILRTGDYLKTFTVTDSKQKTLEIRSKQDVHVILHKDIELSKLTYKFDGINEITPDVPLGAELGTFTIYNGEDELYSTKIYLEDEIDFYDYPLIIAKFIGAGIFIAAIFLGILLTIRAIIQR